MDDFGTGHSALAMLHEFPIDVLKIDPSFVSNLGQGRAFVAVVSAVLMLARNLGIGVVAEGIETAEQLTALQLLDCDTGQGHYFSRALPAGHVYRTGRRSQQLEPATGLGALEIVGVKVIGVARRPR